MTRLGVWRGGKLTSLRAGGLALALIGSVALTSCKRGEAVVQEIAPELAEAEQRTLDIRAEAAGLVEPIATVEALWRVLTAARIGARVPVVIARRLVRKTLEVTPTERR